MKKLYPLWDGIWEWDTETLKWQNLGKKEQEELPFETKKNLIVDGNSWEEVLFGIFTTCRTSPGWESIRAQHDEDDHIYFDLLENHYQQGTLKVDPFLGLIATK